jgi:hypothetical protein
MRRQRTKHEGEIVKRTALCLAAFLIHTPVAAQAPDFNGSFSAAGQNGTVTVTLKSAGNSRYAGTMANGSLTWRIVGEVEDGALVGTVDTGQGVLGFEAHVNGARLQLILVEVGPDGVPRLDQGQELIFTRTQGPAPAQASAGPARSTPAFPGFGKSASGSAADPFAGTFSDGQLTLSLQPANGGYTGQLALGNEAYPVAAKRNGDRVEGSMNAPTGQYGIIISAATGGVVLSNAGTEYALRRVDGNTSADRSGSSPRLDPSVAGAGPANAQAATVDNSPLAQQWRAHLAGRKVTYISSYSSNTAGGGGLSTKFVYHLCSDGRFGFSGSDVVSLNLPGTGVDGGGSAGSSGGTWRIVTQGAVAGIELKFGNGQTEMYRLDLRDGQTFANDNRVYVTPGEVCR